MRAYYQDWESVDAGPVSATVGGPSTSTGFKDCVAASNAADTTAAGDNNGYQTNANRACSRNGTFAADGSSGTGGTQSCGVGAVPDVRKDRHRWWGYAFGLPGTVTSIDGIEVQALLRLNSNGGTTNLCTQLSWDGGATLDDDRVAGRQRRQRLDHLHVRWPGLTPGGGRGRSATSAPANFRVRVIDASTQAAKTFQLDALQVQVTYTP